MHVNTQKNRVIELLGDRGVATEAQLRRLGVWRGAELRGLPTVTRSMVTHGHGSLQTLTFGSQNEELLEGSVGTLGHRAGLFELQTRRPLPAPLQWVEGVVIGTQRHQRPDAMIIDLSRPLSQRMVAAVEIDVGYSRDVLHQKLLGAIQVGATGYILATTIHSRVAWFQTLVAEVSASPKGSELAWAEVHHINFWEARDPYQPRPRCNKLNEAGWTRLGTAPLQRAG